MELRNILLILHIAGAGTWLGANLVQAVAPNLATAAGPTVLAGWYRIAGGLHRLYIPAGLTILITGVWMVLMIDAFSFSSVFVLIGLTVIVISAVMGPTVFSPTSEAAARAIETDDEAAARKATSKLTAFGILDTLLILFAIVVMVLRLGA